MADKLEKQDDSGVSIHYIKGPQYQDFPIHGAYGGINTMNGTIYMAVYAERSPIPQEIPLEVSDSKPGEFKEGEPIGKKGAIRTVGPVLYFDINTAYALRKWLDEKIAVFENAHPELKEAAKK